MAFRIASGIAAALFCLMLGGWSLAKNPRHPANRNFAFFNLTLAIWNLAEAVAYIPDHAFAIQVYRLCYVGGSLIAFSFLSFMSAVIHFQLPWANRIVKWGGIGFAIVSFTGLIIRNIEYSYGQLTSITEIPGPLYNVFMIYFLGSLAYSLYPLFHTYKSSQGSKRNQLRYVILAVVIGITALANFIAYQFNERIFPLFYIVQMGINTTFSIAILKHRLMDITIIIRKTLIYSIVLGALTVLYLGVITVVTHLFEGLTGYQTVFSSAVAAGLIMFCFQPLRKRIQQFVDMKFFRQYVDREEKLYELSREVITHTSKEAMGGVLMRVLGETLHPKAAALYLRSKDGHGFVLASRLEAPSLLERMDEDNGLAAYFKDHPQPFVQDTSADVGQSQSTRLKDDRKDVA